MGEKFRKGFLKVMEPLEPYFETLDKTIMPGTFDSNEPVVPVDLVIERTLVCERYLIDLPVGNLIEVISSNHNNLPMFFTKVLKIFEDCYYLP